MTEPWYRYQDVRTTEGVRVYLSYHSVEKVTPKGVRLTHGKFILRDARKRWACPTKEEALESFKARKIKQIKILKKQLANAELALRRANDPDHISEHDDLFEF